MNLECFFFLNSPLVGLGDSILTLLLLIIEMEWIPIFGVSAPIVVYLDDQHISITIKIQNKVLRLAGVHASTDYVAKRRLLSDLSNSLVAIDIPRCYFGDCNTILGVHEYAGSH